MAYADRQMSTSKIVSIGLVVLIHVLMGYALVTGLAYQAVKKVASELDMIDIQEEEVEEEVEEPPPPPPDKPIEPPPVVSPPPIVSPIVSPSAPTISSVPSAPPAPPPAAAAPPAPPPAPPPPPPPPPQRANPVPRGNPGRWANANDYPSRALREEREGTTRFTLTIGANGRVASCQVTRSSGHADLDAAACKNLKRRGRFKPRLDSTGAATTGTWSSAVRWQIPK